MAPPTALPPRSVDRTTDYSRSPPPRPALRVARAALLYKTEKAMRLRVVFPPYSLRLRWTRLRITKAAGRQLRLRTVLREAEVRTRTGSSQRLDGWSLHTGGRCSTCRAPTPTSRTPEVRVPVPFGWSQMSTPRMRSSIGKVGTPRRSSQVPPPEHQPQECFGLLECMHNNIQTQTQIAQAQLSLLEDMRESMNILLARQEKQNQERLGQSDQRTTKSSASSPNPTS
ncbi:TSSK6-activating co-chaperone protein isoform X3 [Podarcis muralis]